MKLPNFVIDTRLKPRKDYPMELDQLVQVFNWAAASDFKDKMESHHNRVKLLNEFLGKPILGRRRRESQFLKEISQIEKLFEAMFLGRSLDGMAKCLDKINKKLALMAPTLFFAAASQNSIGVAMQYLPIKGSERRDPAGMLTTWMCLAEVMRGLKPALVHKCPECGKIVISKKRKKYCSEPCKKIFLQKKAVKNLTAAKKQKRYRDRLKEKE